MGTPGVMLAGLLQSLMVYPCPATKRQNIWFVAFSEIH